MTIAIIALVVSVISLVISIVALVPGDRDVGPRSRGGETGARGRPLVVPRPPEMWTSSKTVTPVALPLPGLPPSKQHKPKKRARRKPKAKP